jgi:histidine ammonia-lyase
LERLLDLLNTRVHPRVPSRGSVGASGDLAPLAHLSLVLIGEGDAWVGNDPRLHAGRDALKIAGLQPVTLGPKEGLALINGTQPSTAVAALALAGAEQLARAADIAAALSIDALRGSVHPFDERIHAARPYAGTRTADASRTRTRCAVPHKFTVRRAKRSPLHDIFC